MLSLWQDLRYGLRVFIKHPGFALVAILTLALGIGANSAIFSVVNAVLLRPLPFNEPERLVKVYETLPQGKGAFGSVSYPNLQDWRAATTDVFTGLAAYQFGNFNLQSQGEPERISGTFVTSNFFDVFGEKPILGRGFSEGEDTVGHSRVVVISNSLWQRDFGADPSIVGKDISLGGENYTVIGVMSPGPKLPSRLTELWIPLVPDQRDTRDSHSYQVLGRLKPGATLEQAQTAMSVVARGIEQQYQDGQIGRSATVVLLQEEVIGYIRPSLYILLGAVSFVLLIACTNVANLLLARAATRRREIAIRSALGASRFRLIRQFLTESVLLAFLSSVIGLLLAKWGADGLVSLATGYLPRASEVKLDWRVVVFTLFVAVATGIIFGFAPALQTSKADVQEALKEGGSAGSSPRGNWLRSILVVAEVAAALVLLIGAGLLIKSFVRLQRVGTGMQTENVLTMRISLPPTKYSSTESAAAFYDQVLNHISTLPGVEAAGVISILPIQNYGTNSGIEIEGRPPFPREQEPIVEFRVASPGYLRTLGIPLVAGRAFTAQDNQNSEPVVIINQTLARYFASPEEALGHRVKVGFGSGWMKVIGVAADVKQASLKQAPLPEVLVPLTQTQSLGYAQSMSLIVRAAADPNSLTEAIRREVRSVDPNQPIYNVLKMETIIEQSVSYSRLNMLLLTIFAGLALLLAVVGIYSVMSYLVTQHTREIGIRMALGAQPRDILKLVLRQGMTLTVVGLAIGVAGAFALTRLLASLLFGITATDPVTYVAVSALLILVTLFACLIPAWRAMRVDPMVALRYE